MPKMITLDTSIVLPLVPVNPAKNDGRDQGKYPEDFDDIGDFFQIHMAQYRKKTGMFIVSTGFSGQYIRMEKISIFVDVQNIYYTCRQAYQRSFDYNAFWASRTIWFSLLSAARNRLPLMYSLAPVSSASETFSCFKRNNCSRSSRVVSMDLAGSTAA